MREKCTRPDDKIRARSDDEKARVREAIIAAGRELFSRERPDDVSLRRIAAAAGYTPAAIYRYFKHQQDLFVHIRERDMDEAVHALCSLIERKRDPRRRVMALYIGSADYWLEHMEEFLMLFPPPARASQPPPQEEHPFAHSAGVQRLLALYYDTIKELFDTLPRPPMHHRLAADTLLAAVHGSLVFPLMTPALDWPDRREMIKRLVTGMVDHWAPPPGKPAPKRALKASPNSRTAVPANRPAR